MQTKEESSHLLLKRSLPWLWRAAGRRLSPRSEGIIVNVLPPVSWFLIKLTALPEVFHLPGERSARQPRAAGNSKCRTVPPCLQALRGQVVPGYWLWSMFTAPLAKLGCPAATPEGQAVYRGVTTSSYCHLISPTSSAPARGANNAHVLSFSFSICCYFIASLACYNCHRIIIFPHLLPYCLFTGGHSMIYIS